MKKLLCSLLPCLFVFFATSQPTTKNQNSSRSNHTRQQLQDAWTFGFSSGAAVGLKSTEAQLFRGNGFASALQGQYFLGPVGFGLNAGFVNSPLSKASINQFIIDRKFPQGSTVNSTAAQNAFLLAGPALRLGNRVQLLAGLKGGVFFNQGGSLIIGQQGALRPFYRFDAGTRSLQPGWNGTVAVSYPLGTTTALQLNADFLRSSTSVQVFDPQRGIDLPVEQSRKMQVLTTGISFVKTFENKREVRSPLYNGSGQSSGKTKKPPVRNTDPDSDGDGVSLIHPESGRKPVAIKTKATGAEPVRTTPPSCGPVTTKTTHPDGTIEEKTFSCPEDAVQYQRRVDNTPIRISTNVTTPKQTQGATFGEKVNQGMQSAGSHIVAGRIIRTTNESAVVTNQARIGGAASASYAATGRMIQPGAQTNLYVRESGSGLPTGRRSREAGSGLPTGRRQYQPLFFDGLPQEDVCNPCLGQVKTNPLYEEKGGVGNNPLYKGRIVGNEECDDKNQVFDVQLIDRGTGAIVATTKTNSCGEYWFANVPDGSYTVAVVAIWTGKKGYDYYKASSDARIDIAGEVLVPDETWQHIIYGRGGGKVSMQDLSVVVADVDGDGMADVFRATGTFTDGTVQDVTQSSAARGGGAGKASMQDIHFVIPASNQRGGGAGKVSLQDIHFTKRSGSTTYQAVATFSDGKKQDISEYVDVQQAAGIVNISIQVADTDDDGAPDLIWSPRSNFGATSQSAKVNVQDLSFTKKTDRYVQFMPVRIGDVDGDGTEDLVIGNGKVSDFGMSRKSGGFQNGDIPDQNDFSLARPGNPIRGMTVKGGRNPGWDTIPSKRTNALGEFEFPNLEAGNYRFIVETNYLVNDVTDIDLGEEGTAIHTKGGITKLTASQNSQSLRTNTTGGTQPNTKAQDYNSSRSNKTASIASFNDLLEVLNELDQQLQTDNTPQNKAGVSTSRSNVRNLQATVQSIITDLENDNSSAARQKMSNLSQQLPVLQQLLQQLGSRYTTISNVLKTKHDTVKNSIQNVH